jgi:hypothetical protein
VATVPGTTRDSDSDGLIDSDENYWQLDPFNSDTDGDRIDDGSEFYDVYAVSDPSLWDSDYDGLGDGQEVCEIGSNPWNWDSDGDGMGDGDEVSLGRSPIR